MANLLLAEDNFVVSEKIALILTEAGHEVTAALNLTAAMEHLQRAQKTGQLFDMILSDYDLGNRQTGEDVYQCAWRCGMEGKPFIASSSVMHHWYEFQGRLDPPRFYPLPKVMGQWDAVRTPLLINDIITEMNETN